MNLNSSLYSDQLAVAIAKMALLQGRLSELADYHQKFLESNHPGLPFVKPIFGSLSTSAGCNSRCAYCDIWKHKLDFTPVESLKIAIEKLSDLGVFAISLTGGEPTLHPNLLDIVKHISSRKIISQMITNGILLSSNKTELILEAGLDSIYLSLDTVDENLYYSIRGAPLKPVLKGLHHVLAMRRNYPNLMISVLCVVSNKNIGKISDLVKWCSDLGVSIGFQPLQPVTAGHGEASELSFHQEDVHVLESWVEQMIEMQQQGYLINNMSVYLQSFPSYLISRTLPAGYECYAGYTTAIVDQQLNLRNCWPMPTAENILNLNLNRFWESEEATTNRERMRKKNCERCWSPYHAEMRPDAWFAKLAQAAINITNLRI